MSYDLKYQSDFYNSPPAKKLVSIKLYKKDYGVHDIIPLRTSEVSVEFNYQDRFTPIAGTGAKIIFINQGTFSSLEDLLTSLEKQFLCTIEYDGDLVFQGFSICDLNEQQFMPKAKITVQFTDYLRRLESDYLSCINDIGINTSIFLILQEALDKIGLNYPLYVNSTLFEENMNAGVTDTFLEQTFIEDNMFFTSANEYDNTYDVINKILKSMGAILYSHGNKWILERYEDITRTGDWVIFSDISSSGELGASISSLKESYNKQSNNFNHVDGSQILAYDSGLKTLILDLKDKQLGSLVFNNYSIDMLSVADLTPDASTLIKRTWYKYTDVIPIMASNSFKGMNTYFKWTYPSTVSDANLVSMGLYYNFEVQFNIATKEVPTILSVAFKMAGELSLVGALAIRTSFYIRVDGGVKSDYYLAMIEGPRAGTYFLGLSVTPYAWQQIFDVQANPPESVSASQTFNLSDIEMIPQPVDFNPAPNPNGSIQTQLGSPESQKFTIMFFPTTVLYSFDEPPNVQVNRTNFIGDIEVSITQQEILNKITYHINEDFIKTKTLDIDFFDLPNVNFGNGLLRDNGTIKTAKWVSENNTIAVPLMDILAKDIFRNGYRTTHRLKGSIQCDKYLKPLSILTDNNLSGVNLILLGYTWDMNNGIYDIEAEEYTDEEIVFDAEAEASSGGGTIDDPVDLVAPTNLAAVQIAPGDSILVTWDEVIGAIGYILKRVPRWDTGYGYWAYDWKTVYSGINNFYMDYIDEEGAMIDDTTVSYQVCAIVPNGTGPYSSIVDVQWMA